MKGAVNNTYEAIVQVKVRGRGRARRVKAIVDTGYNGMLTLPPPLVKSLRLMWLGEGEAELADGRIIKYNVYAANVLWHGRYIPIRADESETTPLVGMGLMKDFELLVRVRRGGRVTIKPM